MWSKFLLTVTSSITVHNVCPSHAPGGLIRCWNAKDTLKPRFTLFPFQTAPEKKKINKFSPGRFVWLFCIRDTECHWKASDPASLLLHRILWGLSAKCYQLPQISKTGLKPDGRPIEFHMPEFCKYLSLETDYTNKVRLTWRQSW